MAHIDRALRSTMQNRVGTRVAGKMFRTSISRFILKIALAAPGLAARGNKTQCAPQYVGHWQCSARALQCLAIAAIPNGARCHRARLAIARPSNRKGNREPRNVWHRIRQHECGGAFRISGGVKQGHRAAFGNSE